MSNTIVELLSSNKKKDLDSKCKKIEIKSEDFIEFIMLCQSGLCHLEHRMEYFDFVPADTESRDQDWDVLNATEEEMKSIKGKKAFRRVFKMHGLRKYIVGHLFFEKIAVGVPEWHFIFFEINELKSNNNHWKEGAHVHLVNYLWPNMDMNKVWNDFITKQDFPSTKLHVRYKR